MGIDDSKPRGNRTTATSQRTIWLTILVFVLTTAFESTGIVLWLRSLSADRPLLGYGFLLLGEILEFATFVAFLNLQAAGPKNRSPTVVIGAMGLIALFESVIWVIWIHFESRFGLAVSSVALALLMHLKHDADVAAVSDTRLFNQFFTWKGILATGLETLGAVLLLTYARDDRWDIGAAAFLLCNTVEHIVGGAIVAQALGKRSYLTASLDKDGVAATDQNALTVIVAIKPGSIDSLRRILSAIGNDVEGNPIVQFRKSRSTHFARWVILEHEPKLGPRLLFSSNHDGDLQTYCQELAQSVGPGMEQVWVACEGYMPGTASCGQRLFEFFQQHLVPCQAFYVACRGATAGEITFSISLREALDNLLDEMASSPDRALLEQLIPSRAPKAAPLSNRLLSMFGSALGRLAEWLAGIRVGAPTQYDHILAPDELLEIEDRRGLVQNQMTVISPIKRAAWPRLFVRLAFLLVAAQARRAKGSLSGLTTIHFARWVIIDREYLLFESNYDGSWENYIDDFIDFASTGMNVIWGTAIDFPRGGCRDIESFKHIIRRYQVVTQVFYSAYPLSTVRNNLNDLDLARAIRKCCQDESVRRFITGTYGAQS